MGVSTRQSAVSYRRRLFAKEFFIDCNSIKAYARAYKVTEHRQTKQTVARLLSHPETIRYLQEEFEALSARLELQQDRAMLETCRLAYSDIRQVASWDASGMTVRDSATLSDDTAAAIHRVRCIKRTRMVPGPDGEVIPEEEVHTEVEMHPKVTALRMLQEAFHRGDPLSVELERKVQMLCQVMGRYVSADRLAAFRAEVLATLGVDVAAGTEAVGLARLGTAPSR